MQEDTLIYAGFCRTFTQQSRRTLSSKQRFGGGSSESLRRCIGWRTSGFSENLERFIYHLTNNSRNNPWKMEQRRNAQGDEWNPRSTFRMSVWRETARKISVFDYVGITPTSRQQATSRDRLRRMLASRQPRCYGLRSAGSCKHQRGRYVEPEGSGFTHPSSSPPHLTGLDV